MKHSINIKQLVMILFIFISFPAYAEKPKSGHVVAALQNCQPHNCQVLNANGESMIMDMKGKTLDTLTTGDTVIVKRQLYIIEGADLYLENSHGLVPLHVAARGGHTDILNFLLESHRERVNINHQNADGWTALHLAVTNGRTEIVKILLAEGADINIKNRDGKTPLMIAQYKPEILELMENHIKPQNSLGMGQS